MSQDDDIEVVYDKECPICDFYCTRADIDKGNLMLVDARNDSDIMRDITAMGLDIDEGMVVRVGDELHYGSDAIHELALRSTGKGFVNFFGKLVFRSRTAAHLLYPPLKMIRNLLLKLLGRSRINNLQQDGKDRF
jgi:predicted DCC family thiol-disulfide oxidoreductase YuxK